MLIYSQQAMRLWCRAEELQLPQCWHWRFSSVANVAMLVHATRWWRSGG